jgi:hypothetical protein
MKAQARILLAILTLTLCLPAAAQEREAGEPAAQEPAAKEPWLFVGPRAGLTWAMTSASRFDQELQELFSGTRSYFPLYSQLGLSLAQHLRLRPGGSRLVIQEAALLSGLDQNYALPALNLLVGVHFAPGVEASLGPELIFPPSGGVQAALIYALGWRFPLKAASVPVLLVFSPLPEDRLARLTLLSGIDFELLPKIHRKKTPFNY